MDSDKSKTSGGINGHIVLVVLITVFATYTGYWFSAHPMPITVNNETMPGMLL